MPIVLDRELPPPALPTRIISDDGRLTAWVDQEHAGVLLCYRGETDSRQVLLTRHSGGPDGDTLPVRSGDAALTPGGVGFAWDAEPGLGAACFYQAIPVDTDGHEGEPSRLGLAAAGGLEPGGLPQVWLTSTVDTSRTRPVVVKELPDLEYEADTDAAVVLGSSTPIVVSAPTAAPEFDVTVVSATRVERDELATLLRVPGFVPDGTTPPVVLLRWETSSYQRHDQYAVVTKVAESAPAHARAATRELQIGLTVVARPDPSGAVLRVPWTSYAALRREWPSYADLSAHGTYAGLLTPGEGV